MRIIKKGTLPEKIEYEHICYNCGTVFAVTIGDRTEEHQYKMGMKCPVCGAFVEWSGDKPLTKETEGKDMEQEILDEFSKIMRK